MMIGRLLRKMMGEHTRTDRRTPEQYRDRRIFCVAGLDWVHDVARYAGRNFVRVVPEPENHFDHDALAIVAEDGHPLGYVPRHLTGEVRKIVALPYDTELYISKEYDAEGRSYYLGQLLI